MGRRRSSKRSSKKSSTRAKERKTVSLEEQEDDSYNQYNTESLDEATVEEVNTQTKARGRHVFRNHSATSTVLDAPPSKFSLKQAFISFLLPEHYPESVTKDYLAFQVYDSLQGLSSYLRGILCTQAVLVGVGVGDAEASALSATLLWVTRDGFGMLGASLFGWLYATKFGENIKLWRLFADVINDIGLTLELLSPLCGDWFYVMVTLAALCYALCGVAAGATRAALTAHFARTRNLSDVSAKEGIQEKSVTIVGMILGVGLSSVIADNLYATWLCFVILTLLHVYWNYKGMQSLIFNHFNLQRAQILIHHYLERGQILSPAQVAQAETLWYRDPGHVKLGVSFSQLKLQDARDMEWCLVRHKDDPFLLSVPRDEKTNKKLHVNVVLFEFATDIHAFLGLLAGIRIMRDLPPDQPARDEFIQGLFVKGWHDMTDRHDIHTHESWRISQRHHD